MMINHRTEPVSEWARGLHDADTLARLRAFTATYRRVAADADDLVKTWTDAEFVAWRKALRSERRGKYIGDAAAARFGPVLMPYVMSRVALISLQFAAPWGTAFVRMREIGMIV